MKKKTDAAVRVPLFDRVFKPQTVVLANGHSVARPRSRGPLIFGIVVLMIWLSIQLTGFDLGIIARRGNQFMVILSQVFSPDLFNIKADTFARFGLEAETVGLGSILDGRWWQALWYTMEHSFAPTVFSPLWDTLRMSVLGSFIGATLALPIAVAAAAAPAALTKLRRVSDSRIVGSSLFSLFAASCKGDAAPTGRALPCPYGIWYCAGIYKSNCIYWPIHRYNLLVRVT